MHTSKILITGASAGIGEATAHRFAEGGHELFLVARRPQRLAEVATACRSRGARRVVHQSHDLSIPGQGAVIVENCLKELGGLDILICNAGYGVYGPLVEIPPAEMARLWQVNYQSGYESIHAALPHMLAQKRGHIVLVSSVIGKKALPFAATYCATKFAQVALGDSLWGELKGQPVHVSIVCPGSTATEFQQAALKTESLKTVGSLGNRQSPQQVARAILEAVVRRKREVHLTTGGRLLCLLERISPSLVSHLVAWFIHRQRQQADG